MIMGDFILELPKDAILRGQPAKILREQLKAKLVEYQGRVGAAKGADDSYDTPERIAEIQEKSTDARYKEAVLGELLKSGRVSFLEVEKELAGEISGFNSGKLLNAFRVIREYITTGGKGVRGGTGLPSLK
jgi:hypothetical protein